MAETVGAALIRDGLVLLGLRAAHKSFAGTWDLIGGHIEPGEMPWAALCRELIEELGIEALSGDYVDTLTIRDSTHRSSILHIYTVAFWQGEPSVRNDEHSEIRWFDLDEARHLSNLATPQYSAVFTSLGKRRQQPDGS